MKRLAEVFVIGSRHLQNESHLPVTLTAYSDKLFSFLQGDKLDFRHVLHRDGSVIAAITLDQLKVRARAFHKRAALSKQGVPSELLPVEHTDRLCAVSLSTNCRGL